MIAGLKKVDKTLAHEVNHAVLLRQPPRPRASELILQWFRLADARKRIPEGRFDDVESAQRRSTIVLDPESQIVEKLRVEDGQTPRCHSAVSALFLCEPDFAAKLANRLRFESPAASATQRGEQALRISGSAEKVSRLQDAAKLGRGDQGHFLRAPALDDDRLPARHGAIAERGESRPCCGIGDGCGHNLSLYRKSVRDPPRSQAPTAASQL